MFLRIFASAALVAVQGPAVAESRPGSASNLDCAVIYTLVGQGAASDEDRGHLFYLAAYFIGLHEAETTSGWYDPRIVGRFARFVAKVMPAIAPHVRLYCTLNEPNVFLYGGFAAGLLCPGHQREDAELFPVRTNLFRAHVAAGAAIRAARPDARIGIAHNCTPFEPAPQDASPLEGIVAAFFATAMGFALIWHIWWLVILGFFGAWGTFIVFAWRDKAEYEIPVEEVERLDQARRRSKATLLDLPEEALS